MCGVRGERPLCAADHLLALRHGKSNSTDESIIEMNEGDSAMIHESRSLETLQATNTFYKITSVKLYTEPRGIYVGLLTANI